MSCRNKITVLIIICADSSWYDNDTNSVGILGTIIYTTTTTKTTTGEEILVQLLERERERERERVRESRHCCRYVYWKEKE